MRGRVVAAGSVVFALMAASCGSTGDDAGTTAAPVDSAATSSSAPVAVNETTTTTEEEVVALGSDQADCAHVIDATVAETGPGFFSVAATVRSSETGWDKYADRWEVRGPDGSVLGERILLHPHENEQPFTRSLANVEIPTDVTEVTIAAHDSVVGFCGETYRVNVPGR